MQGMSMSSGTPQPYRQRSHRAHRRSHLQPMHTYPTRRRNTGNTILRILSIALLLIGFTMLVTPQLAIPTTISQGDTVIINDTAKCTIGYVDKASHRAFLAAHCSQFKNAENVRISTPWRTDIGDIIVNNDIVGYNHATDNAYDIVDIGVIALDKHVTVGDNSYSGNNIISTKQLRDGDQLCRVDIIQQRGVLCSPPHVQTTHYITAQGNVITQGDSGGPMWVRDAQGKSRGLVGIIAGFSDDAGKQHIDIATMFDPNIWLLR